MNKPQKAVLLDLYDKWITEKSDALHYGQMQDAVNDFDLLFKVLKVSTKQKTSKAKSK